MYPFQASPGGVYARSAICTHTHTHVCVCGWLPLGVYIARIIHQLIHKLAYKACMIHELIHTWARIKRA